MEQQQQTKGVGKESQLSRIAAAVNPGSSTEANPESTKSMIQTFIKHFDSVALELIQEMDDDQKDLVKNMVAEITKLQTKNIEEFQKAIGKIVGITNKMIESDNPKMQQLGQGLQDQAKEELFKAKGITLTGEKDTFANRLGREFGMNTEKEPVSGVKGVGKLAKGFVSNSASGFKAGLKESFMPQGGMLDRIFTSDEDKRQRELENIEQTAGQTESESLADMFKKVVEQMLKEGKEEKPSSEKPEEQGITPAPKNDAAKALAPISSEQQEDASGISADNATAGMAAIGATLASLQTNSEDSLEIFKKSLEKLEYISKWIEDNGESLLAGAGGAGGGGGLLDTVSNLAGGRAAGSLLPSAGALATGAAVTAGVAGVAYGAYKGYTGYQDAKQKEQAANKEIDEKVARGELTQAQGLEQKDKTKKTGRIEKSKAVGQGAGIAAGAAGGAALGAMYGSALGPLGTAVGGVGGALVGGFVGGGGGKWLGEKAGQLSNWWNDDSDKKKGKAKPAAQAKPITPSTPAKAAAPVAMNKLAAAEEEKKPDIKKPATVEKKPEIKKPVASETVKEVTTPKEKSESKPKTTKAPNLDAVDKSIKGKVAEIDPNGRWAKLKDGKIVDPDFPGDADSNYTAQQAYKLSQKNNKVESPKNTTGENLEKSSNKKVAKTETGKNVDGTIIEAGTAATKDKMQVNVPPPTVVNQGGGGGGQSGPTITAPGGVGSVRSDDPTWLRFQQKRAVA